MAPGDTARLYHRLTSYSYVPPGVWPTPVDHPLVLQDFAPNDFGALADALQGLSARAARGRATAYLARDRHPRHGRAGRAVTRRAGAARPPHARPAAPPLGRRRASLAVQGSSAPAVPSGGLGRWTFPVRGLPRRRAVSTAWPTGSTGTTRSTTRSCRSGHPPSGDVTTLVVTGVPWRTGWRYSERGFRHIYWDVGTMLAQTLALADSAGLAPRLWTRFPDADVARTGRRRRRPRVPGRAWSGLGRRGAGDPAGRRGGGRGRRSGADGVPPGHARPARRRWGRARRPVVGRPSSSWGHARHRLISMR